MKNCTIGIGLYVYRHLCARHSVEVGSSHYSSEPKKCSSVTLKRQQQAVGSVVSVINSPTLYNPLVSYLSRKSASQQWSAKDTILSPNTAKYSENIFEAHWNLSCAITYIWCFYSGFNKVCFDYLTGNKCEWQFLLHAYLHQYCAFYSNN